jgi:hypothetical protein
MHCSIFRRSYVSLALVAILICLAQTMAGAKVIYSTNFDFTPTNWQGWSASNGVWAIGAPTNLNGPGATFNHAKDCAASGLNADYPANQGSFLISPAITLPAAVAGRSTVLQFAQWFQLGGGNGIGAGTSFGDIQVSTVGPAGPWSGPLSGYYSGTSADWDLTSVDLSVYAGDQIWIAFDQEGGPNTGAGWFLDDMSVSTVQDMAYPASVDFDDFTTTNWQGWSASNGVWQVGAPTNPDPNAPTAAYNGDAQCASSGLTADYPANQGSYLISPAVTLPAATPGQSLVLGFWQSFQFGGGNGIGAGTSFGDVAVQTWNGTAWSGWTQVSSYYSGDSAGWDFSEVDLAAYAGERIQFGFAQNGGPNPGAGWFIDNVSLSSVPDMQMNQMVNFGNFTATNWQGWSANNGVWQVGAPTNPDPNAPTAAYNGDTQCASSGLAADYPANQGSGLISPAVTLPAVAPGQSLALGFWQWFQFGGGNGIGAGTSFGNVAVQTWNGTAWSGWTQVSPYYSGDSAGWDYTQVDLTAYAGDRIQVGFGQNGGPNSGAGWFIDNVNVFIPPPTIQSLTLKPVSVPGGTSAVATVTLAGGPAQAGGFTVTIKSGKTAVATVGGASFTIPAGSTSGTFTVTTYPVSTETNVGISAKANGYDKVAVLTVKPAVVASLTVKPASVIGGKSSTGTITLDGPAAANLTVDLSSSESAATVPTSATVLAGQTTATFTIDTTAVTIKTVATITVSGGGGTSRTATLTVKP